MGSLQKRCAVCGIYGIIWWYGVAERLKDAGTRANVDTKISGGKFLVWTILGSLLCGLGPIYAMHLIMSATNKLAAVYNAKNAAAN